jgi:hypothetical protein
MHVREKRRLFAAAFAVDFIDRKASPKDDGEYHDDDGGASRRGGDGLLLVWFVVDCYCWIV